MPGRTLALGDTHGCLAALDTVLSAIDLRPDDTLVTLGDYTDRGPDSRGVIDRLIAESSRCRVVPLRGNHDLMFLGAIESHAQAPDRFAEAWNAPELMMWLDCGGFETIDSYGSLAAVPPEHVAFLRDLRDDFETDTHLFVHANYDPDLPMDRQPPDLRFWTSLRESMPPPHRSGKTVVVGHTSQKNGQVLHLGHLLCIDTYCYGGGWLTAIDLHTGQTWQANMRGLLRK